MGRPQRGMYLFTKIPAVPTAVNPAAETAYTMAATVGANEDVGVSFWRTREGAEIIHADRDAWVGGRNESDRTGKRTVCLDVLRARH